MREKAVHNLPLSTLAAGILLFLLMTGCSSPSKDETVTNDVTVPSSSDSEPSPLLEAVWRGQAERVQTLVDEGANVNLLDSRGNPVLLEAIWRGHENIVEILVTPVQTSMPWMPRVILFFEKQFGVIMTRW